MPSLNGVDGHGILEPTQATSIVQRLVVCHTIKRRTTPDLPWLLNQPQRVRSLDCLASRASTIYLHFLQPALYTVIHMVMHDISPRPCISMLEDCPSIHRQCLRLPVRANGATLESRQDYGKV